MQTFPKVPSGDSHVPGAVAHRPSCRFEIKTVYGSVYSRLAMPLSSVVNATHGACGSVSTTSFRTESDPFMDCKEDFADRSNVQLGLDGALVTCNVAAVARSHFVPRRLEVLPFLCSLADSLRRAMDPHIFVDVFVDRTCLAWAVDRRSFESALEGLVQTSHWAAVHGGRLVLRATVGPAGNTVLEMFGTAKITNNAYGPGVTSPFFPGAGTCVLTHPGLAEVVNVVERSGGSAQLSKCPWGGATLALSLPGYTRAIE